MDLYRRGVIEISSDIEKKSNIMIHFQYFIINTRSDVSGMLHFDSWDVITYYHFYFLT